MSGPEKKKRDRLAQSQDSRRHEPPDVGATLRLSVHAMACEFGAAVDAGQTELLLQCGEALEVVPEIEGWLSPWKSGSQLSQLNTAAADGRVTVSPPLFDVLQLAAQLHDHTSGGFDMASGAQIELWSQCRAAGRLPTDNEVAQAVQASGMTNVQLSEESRSVHFSTPGLLLSPGAIGKGYALDEAVRFVAGAAEPDSGFLLHGGRSSLLARGAHGSMGGWPVGIGNPLLTRRRLGTVILRNQALSTSGSNIQFFRCEGRRFGHILDPRCGWPVDGMLSVTVVAESAAVADAVSTAFFVLGVEKAIECCDTIPNIGAILIPFPQKGARVEPVVIGIPDDQIIWDEELVALR